MGSGGTDKPLSKDEQRKILFADLRAAHQKLREVHRELGLEMPLIIGKRYIFGDEYWELCEVHYRDCVLKSAFDSKVTVSTDQLEWASDR